MSEHDLTVCHSRLIFVISKTDDKVNEYSKMRFVTILCVLLVQIFPSRADLEREWNTSLEVNFTDYEEELKFKDYEEDLNKRQALSSRANEENSYSLFEEHTLAKNTLLRTFSVFEKEWSISFELNPSHYEQGLSNLLYFSPVLAIFIHCFSCSENPTKVSYVYRTGDSYKWLHDEELLPKVGEWTQITVSQQFDGKDYKIYFNNGSKSDNVFNPRILNNVRLFASGTQAQAQPGQIRKLHVINGHIG